MSKAVLLSIKPKWCLRIARGEKTIEVRKTKPKMETPFKCYMYQTKVRFPKSLTHDKKPTTFGGFVIGEFVCDKIDMYASSYDETKYRICDNEGVITDEIPSEEKTCLSKEDLYEYGEGGLLYGWHISDLKLYDEPKELSEFTKPCIYGEESEQPCYTCEKSGFAPDMFIDCFNTIRRAPQSWCYVEEQ